MSKDVAIYGLFNDADECIYIGRTTNIKGRCSSHKHDKKFKEIRVIKWASEKQSWRVEFETIKKYRKNGQPLLNINPPPAATEYKTRTPFVKSIQIRNDLYADFRAKVKANGQTMNFVIGILIANYIAGQEGK